MAKRKTGLLILQSSQNQVAFRWAEDEQRSMKFLHTADWHLGRLFHQVHLTDDQSVVLEEVVEISKREAVDVVLVAGDLYDRAVPPPEAVTLLDRIWEKLVMDAGIPVVAISGNHDSAARVGYGSKLLAKAGLHIVSDLESAMHPTTIGGVDIFALPYGEPAEVRAWSGDVEVRDHASAMNVCLKRMKSHFHPGRPRMLVGHAFVQGMKESESERPLSVGGASVISADVFEDFDYVALGHLHAPQFVNTRCLYSGSILKYSFSEAADVKSVVIGDMDSNGAITPRLIPLHPRRDVRDLEGRLVELIQNAPMDPHREDYLRVILTDEGALLNAISRLREVYPNVMQLERRFLQTVASQQSGQVARRREATENELFANFFEEVLGVAPTLEDQELFNEVLSALHQSESETKEVPA